MYNNISGHHHHNIVAFVLALALCMYVHTHIKLSINDFTRSYLCILLSSLNQSIKDHFLLYLLYYYYTNIIDLI